MVNEKLQVFSEVLINIFGNFVPYKIQVTNYKVYLLTTSMEES